MIHKGGCKSKWKIFNKYYNTSRQSKNMRQNRNPKRLVSERTGYHRLDSKTLENTKQKIITRNWGVNERRGMFKDKT